MTVPGQRLPPENVRSLQLFRNSESNAPIIRLNSSERLTLRFDDLSRESSMFRVEITHHNRDWSLSNVIPNLYLRGFMQDFIHGGQVGRFQNPSWHAYEYTFPNEQMGIRISGNFMLHVYRQETNEHLFSLPFLVHEATDGDLTTSYEELYNLDSRYMRHHQLFARFTYDDPHILPQNDLSIYFVQNQFWSLAREADQQDFSEQGVARMYLSRSEAFIGTFEFMHLNLSQIDQYSLQITDFRDGQRIPQVTLQRDIVNLGIAPSNRNSVRFTAPSRRFDARYALVRFQLEVPDRERTDDAIYVVGGFNNWGISPQNRMQWSASEGLYTGQVVVKEGNYAYKYVTSNGRRVNLTRLDASFASTRQEYHTLVYLRDQALQADRLVAVNRFFSTGF
ncbi:MAG: DUF5103 domain-containing protein [Bacteroidetes bacterium]|nr:DUF5103 domain-containing protein [Bacteroidota bacterium]MCH8523470.1 DUF5103 domain-containing protein [Balneolales bacterium]